MAHGLRVVPDVGRPGDGAPPPPSATARRADVQHLRAVAVLAVLADHAGVPGAAGGFVGVDVFLVVSGYLITRLLVLEVRATGRLDLRAFAGRRVRRLLPAATVVLVASAALLAATANAVERAIEATVLRSAAVFGANVALAARGADYFAQDVPPSIVQHYWSLGLEEQFYVVWPVVLAGAVWWCRRRSLDVTRAVLVTLAVAAVASLVVAWTSAASDPSAAYFLLPARVWEFAVGGVLGVAELRGRRVPGRGRWMRVAGWSGIVVAVLVVPPGGGFPWPWALLPVAATLAVLATRSPPTAAGVPGGRPTRSPSDLLAGLGDRSYSLYLWHWPLLVVVGLHGTVGVASPAVRAGMVAVALALAEVTFRLVEEPMRRASRLRRPGATPRLLVACVALSLLAAVAATTVPGGRAPAPSPLGPLAPEAQPGPARQAVSPSPAPLPALAPLPPAGPVPLPARVRPAPEEAFVQRGFHEPAECHAPADRTEPNVGGCVVGDPDGDVLLALVGDSHAAHWWGAFDVWGAANGVRVLRMTKSGCSLGSLAAMAEYAHDDRCQRWGDAVHRVLVELEPDAVALGTAASQQPYGHALGPWLASVREELLFLRTVLPQDTTLVHLVDVPVEPTERSIAICVADEVGDVRACAPPVDTALRAAEPAALGQVPGLVTVDPVPLLCPASHGCLPVRGDVLVWADDDHISHIGSREVLVHVLAAQMPALRPR